MSSPRQLEALVSTSAPPAHAASLGFWTSLLVSLLAVTAFAFGITTPPRSGPYCLSGPCIAYPYTNAAQYVPRDYYWVAPALLLLPAFLVVAHCLHTVVPAEKKHLSSIALNFTSIAAALIALDYFLQFQIDEPSLLKNETAGLSLFTQYNPHGFFIALEDLGYLTLCLAFLFLSPAVPRTVRAAQAIRWTLLIAGSLGLATFAEMTWHYGLNIDYRFEVAVITIIWTTSLILGIECAVFFRSMRIGAPNPPATAQAG